MLMYSESRKDLYCKDCAKFSASLVNPNVTTYHKTRRIGTILRVKSRFLEYLFDSDN